MRSSLDRYLRSKNYLEGEARELRDKGMGHRLNKALAITRREEEILWESSQLGRETPQAIINTVWFYLTQHFGLRGRQEHVTVVIEDFTTSSDNDDNNTLLSRRRGPKREMRAYIQNQDKRILKLLQQIVPSVL